MTTGRDDGTERRSTNDRTERRDGTTDRRLRDETATLLPQQLSYVIPAGDSINICFFPVGWFSSEEILRPARSREIFSVFDIDVRRF